MAKYILPLCGDFSSLRSLALWLRHKTERSLFLNRPDTRLLEDIRARFTGSALPGLLDIVAHCNALRNLSILTLEGGIEVPGAAENLQLSLPNLRSLRVEGHSLMKLVSFWDLPRRLHLTLDEDMDGFFPHLIFPPTLRTLELHGSYPCREQPVLDFISNTLQRQVSLMAIEIPSWILDFSAHALQTLIASQEVCPRLTHLWFLGHKYIFPLIEPTLQLLIKRRPHIRITIGMLEGEPQVARFYAYAIPIPRMWRSSEDSTHCAPLGRRWLPSMSIRAP